MDGTEGVKRVSQRPSQHAGPVWRVRRSDDLVRIEGMRRYAADLNGGLGLGFTFAGRKIAPDTVRSLIIRGVTTIVFTLCLILFVLETITRSPDQAPGANATASSQFALARLSPDAINEMVLMPLSAICEPPSSPVCHHSLHTRTSHTRLTPEEPLPTYPRRCGRWGRALHCCVCAAMADQDLAEGRVITGPSCIMHHAFMNSASGRQQELSHSRMLMPPGSAIPAPLFLFSCSERNSYCATSGFGRLR